MHSAVSEHSQFFGSFRHDPDTASRGIHARAQSFIVFSPQLPPSHDTDGLGSAAIPIRGVHLKSCPRVVRFKAIPVCLVSWRVARRRGNGRRPVSMPSLRLPKLGASFLARTGGPATDSLFAAASASARECAYGSPGLGDFLCMVADGSTACRSVLSRSCCLVR